MNRPDQGRSRAAALIAFLLASGGLAFAGAQDDAAPEEESGAVEVVRRADLSPQQQVEEAEAILRRGRDLSRRIAGVLDEARQESDIIRITCVNDKLTQINANVRTLESRIQSLRDAVEAEDASRRNHEYTVVSVLGEKFNALEREANQCIGQDIFETGSTRLTTEIDPTTPDDDPLIVQDPADVTVPFVPPPASGTM